MLPANVFGIAIYAISVNKDKDGIGEKYRTDDIMQHGKKFRRKRDNDYARGEQKRIGVIEYKVPNFSAFFVHRVILRRPARLVNKYFTIKEREKVNIGR